MDSFFSSTFAACIPSHVLAILNKTLSFGLTPISKFNFKIK